MKSKKMYIISGWVLLMGVLFSSPSAADPVLTVKNIISTINNTIGIEIEVDDPSDIAAAVFSITYTSKIPGDISLNNVGGAPFFDEFEWNDDGLGTIMFCGAKKIPSGAGNTTILTLIFNVAATATGDYDISLVDSSINNQDAGYPPGGEDIPVLTGLNPYPVLAADTSGSVSGQLSIDRDNDGLTDTRELALGMNIDSEDSDGDGMGDFWEVDNMPPMDPVVNDALGDPDMDGYTNLRENLSGTNPGGYDNPSAVPVIADVQGSDNDIDGRDLLILANELAAPCSGPSCDCDFDGNDQVNDVDLKLFTEDFGRSD